MKKIINISLVLCLLFINLCFPGGSGKGKAIAVVDDKQDAQSLRLDFWDQFLSMLSEQEKLSTIVEMIRKKQTILHAAVMHGNAESVRSVLRAKLVDVNAQDHAGWTALHHACLGDKVEIIVALLEEGRANPNIETVFHLKPHELASERAEALLIQHGAIVDSKKGLNVIFGLRKGDYHEKNDDIAFFEYGNIGIAGN
ncbi:MAG: ankyrin repeat domain-containing protein [Epsilonproteobacteria bacterium]|nr:ankyrin repeat domain-containing protein [Campylobacterota bacterium]